ncbi:right-handed parallel beta-helix repeat-containing protein [Methanobrevibacter sp.]|uniref:right-handed parallel beta-helix repeat-containing protein n=1 Tax=Methanobrevibacter sp. TaxID=66852 RepID=UPI00388F43ED
MQIVPEGGSIFLCNGDYALFDAMFIPQSVSFVGESRDGVKLIVSQGFAIANPENPFDEEYTVDSISFSKMTIEGNDADTVIYASANVNELNITDCVISGVNNHLVSTGVSVINEPMQTTGTLNFKRNILQVTTSGTLWIAGNWNANINNNLFVIPNEDVVMVDSTGDVNVDYNYWGSSDPTLSVEPDVWIEFTANANPSEIYNDESSEITVAAVLNDGSDASSYLPDYSIPVTLSAKGTLSQNEFDLNDGPAQATYTSDVARSEDIKAFVFTETLTIPITVKERYTGIIYVDVSGSDDNEGSINAPVATIAKAIELANAGSHEIIINEGTYVGNGYHVTDDLTVTGNGKVTLDANNEGRFFFMNYGDAANKIELHNLVLTNANGYGAAIYSLANELVLDNVTIVNNQATGYLITSKGKLTIKDSEISNSMSGDVIQQTGNGDILINNTVFKDNSIVDSTSVMAVINLNTASGNLVIENSKFINNTARQGVIKGNYNYNIDVKGTEFIDNTNTVSYGGAIYTSGGTLDVTDCVFVNNKAARAGGAIYVGYRSTATVDKSIFVNNVANTMDDDYHGDAIYNGNKLTVNNSVLLTNADNDLIYNDGEDNVVNAQNNWWGTNDDPSSLNGVGYYEDDDWEEYECPEVDVSNWVTMDASFTPEDAQAGDEVTVTAVFSNANLPDGINVTFTSTSGNLNTVVSTVDAQASTTYTIDANDEAIVATSTNAVVEMPIAEELTNIVTQDNFYTFFDESGFLRDDVPFEELIFQGEFSDLAAGYVIITKPVTITGDNAVLNNIGFVIASEDVALDNLTLIATTPLGDLISVTESGVGLTNLTIYYLVDEDGSSNAINVKGTGTIAEIYILDCDIYFESHTTRDNNVVTAINLDDVEDVYIDGNNIVANMPSLTVESYDFTYFMMGLSYVNPIRIHEVFGVELTNNNIEVIVNSYDSSFPTVQALYIVGSEDVLVKGNNFTMVDTLTPAGTAIYLYAVECGFSSGIEFIENNFNISTTGGQSGSGSAYALQVATSEATFIGNNITCDSNGPNLGIYSPYGFGAAKDLIIKDNFLNISGYATGKNDFALISGIEIQTGYATIYNNTIYAQNKGDYEDDCPVTAISAVQYSAKTLTFDIKDNEVYTNGKYAVEMLYPPEYAVVVGNTLYAYELTGDEAVYIKSGDNNTVHDNLPAEELTNIVTNDTFFRFFDENGILLDTIEFDELIFQGEFSDLVDTIIISDEITLTSDNAVLNNIALCITGDDVTVTGFTLNENDADFTNNGGAAIYVSGTDVTLDNVSVTYNAPDEVEAKAIFANGAENFALINSEIIFTGASPGSNHYRGLEVRNSDGAKIDNNTISADLPAVDVSWSGEGIAQDLVLAVGIQGGEEVEFTNNIVTVNTNGGVGSFPTIDAVMVHSVNDVLIKGNNISLVDTTTEDSARYYYSLDIYSTTGTVEANNIIVNTTAGVDRAGTAYPVQLTGPFTVTVKDNNLTAVSKGPIAGIYTSNWGGPATLTVENNNIDVTGYATTGNYALVAGIEAEIDVFKAYNNTITVANGADYDDANQVIGVGIGSSYFYGDTSADIKDNNITVDGKYAVYYAKAINTNVTGNTLYGHELEGDDAAIIEDGENNIIKDNLPVKAYDGIIYVDIDGSDDNEGSEDAPVATIAKAVELALAGSGQIIVNEGTYDVPQVSVAGDLNITGNGNVVFKAQDATKRAFWITSGDVSIKGVTFTNFNATNQGSVIRVDAGSLTIDDSKFIKNGGENRQALIQVKGADLTLTNTVFEENTASKTGTSYGNVYIVNNGDIVSTLDVNNCTFVNNHNKYGAFYIGSTIATIRNSSFIGNNATSSSGGSGAAIYASGTATYISSYSGNLMTGLASYVLIEGCEFINNTAFGGTYYAGQGGAIYVNNNVTMFINDCLFENNSVRNNTGNDKLGQGGAIYASAGKVIIDKSIFKNNDAAEGSEIYMRYYNNHLHPEEVNTLDISNSIILNDGVAIVADSTNGTYVANDNWWGTNDEPADKAVNVNIDSWATMDASFTPEDAQAGDEVTVTAVFSNPNLPDGIEVTFTSTSGLNTIVSTVDAQASTTYTIDASDKEINATSGSAVIVMPIGSTIATVLSADDLEMTFKNGSAWTVTLTDGTNPIEGAVVKVGILGKTYSLITAADGTVSLPINVAPGTYDVNATFEGDDTYESAFVNATVTVNKAISTLTAEDLTMAYKNGSWIVTLTGAEGVIPKAGIKFGILGKVYTIVTDENGVASLPINLAPGTYEVNATFEGNYKHESAFVSATVTVEKSTVTLTAEDLTMCYKDGTAYEVTVTDANGAPVAGTTVKFTFGTKSYNIKTDANGVAALPINLIIGEYEVSVVVDDARYTSEEATQTISVTDYDAVLVANDINMTYQDGTSYEVQLTTADGTPIAVANLVVKITINGKTYNIKTDAEGIAKVPINLRAGNYTVTAEYNGAEITNTIVVNKA